MKQSTKLLSLVLALVMAFSCMSVIGNAALVDGSVVWDSIDDACLTPEQVADIALDLVDNDLLADMETIDLSVLGELRLNKIDYIFEDICSLRGGFIWAIGSGLLKNLGAMDFSPLAVGGDYDEPYQRSHGDIVIARQLLQFIGNNNNSEILSRIAYGMGDSGTLNSNGDLTNTCQLNLGLISSFLDLGDVGDILNDLPGFLVTMVYDMLVYGSYNPNYENDSYPSSEEVTALPTDMDTLDEMAPLAILNLLTNPQDYTWEGEGDDAVKTWDTGAVILPSLKQVKDDYIAAGNTEAQAASFVSPLTNSVFGLLDFAAQYAIDDLGINALNNNLKKGLMEAVEVDFNECGASNLPANVVTDFEVSVEDGQESYVNYIAYDRICKGSDGNWYYTTMKNELMVDDDGNPVLDEDGNEQTERVRKYYKANPANANEFYGLINWDWKFVTSTEAPDTSKGEIQLLYSNIVKDYDGDGTASIVEGINDLLNLVFDAALTDAVKADFQATVGSDYVGGANSNLMTNVNNLAKYILVNFGELVFGSTSPYAHLEYDAIKDMDTVDLIAMIGPGFFEDVMPQVIMPKNADGTYAFHDGVQIYEFGALIIREFISDITPNVNYDEYIFAEGVDSANGRQFRENTVEQWFNIILNMGVDIGYTYLYNITNFGDMVTFTTDGLGFATDANFRATIAGLSNKASFPELPTLDASADATSPYTSTRWLNMLDEAIMWAVRYLGPVAGTSVLKGFDTATIGAISGPLNKLSYVLNTLLPLGFVNGYSTSSYDFDVNSFLNDGLKSFFTTFDLSLVLGLLGRNTKSSYNFLDDTNIAAAVLDLVNDILYLVFGNTILQGVDTTAASQSLDAVLTQANLKKTVAYLLRGLNTRSGEILINALPIVGKLIKGWGTEQAFQTPDISLARSITLSSGATTEAQTVTVRNASNGVWRHYKTQSGGEATDNQYKIIPVSVAAYNLDGTASSYVTCANLTTTTIDYGKTGTFTYTVTGVPAEGAMARFDYTYKILDEDGAEMAGGKTFKVSSYVWLNYTGTDAGTTTQTGSTNMAISWGTIKQYIDMSTLPSSIENVPLIYIQKGSATCLASKPYISIASGSGDGLSNFTGSQVTLNNGERNWAITPYKSQDIWCTGENAGEQGTDSTSENQITITSNGFDSATWEALGKVSGDTGSVTANLSGAYPKSPSLVWSSMTSFTNSVTATFRYYDGAEKNSLAGLAGGEMATPRLKDQYNVTGTSYANGLLTYQDKAATEDTDFILRQSNYSTTAWIDDDKNVYAESAVSDIVETTNDDGEVTAKTGKVTVDGEIVPVKLVTAIDNATAWAAYEAALVAGARGGYEEFNDNAVYDFEARYNTLKVAINDVNYLKKTTEDLVAEGAGDDVDGDIDALKTSLATVEAATTDNHNYTDYQMYRLNRLNDARDDAAYYINLKNDASNATVGEIDENFPYTWINEDDLRALVKCDAIEGLILALLEMKSEEEIDATEEWLANKKLEYASVSTLDVEMASNYLDRVSGRLLYRFVDDTYTQVVESTYLDGELASIENMMLFDADGEDITEQTAALYTERSWNAFMAAYETACLVYENTDELPFTQKNVFDAKYNLMVARNNLVLVEEEADYTELEALIAQAQQALGNMNLYDNTTKEFGQVLAELGYDAITNADGDDVQLFPDSALLVNERAYSIDDQNKIDNAAAALKEALARLNFKEVAVTYDSTVVNEIGTLIEADEQNNIDEKTAKISRVASETTITAAIAKYAATAAGVTAADDIVITNDYNYSIVVGDDEVDGNAFVGTGATVTFYVKSATDASIMIPIATVKVVVNGDINGDGAVDVLDGAYAQFVAAEKAELHECYLLAGDLDATNERVVDDADYTALVNIICA